MNWVYSLVEVIASFIEIYIIYCIFGLFFEKRYVNAKHNVIQFLFAIIVTALTLWLNTFALYSYLTAAIGAILIVLLSRFLYKATVLQAFCIAAVCMVLINALDFLTISIAELIFNVKGVTLEVMTSTGPYRCALVLGMKIVLVTAYVILSRRKQMRIPLNTKICIIIIASSIFCFFCMQYLIEAVVIGNVADMRRAVLIAWLFIILFIISFILILKYNMRFSSERLASSIVATRLETLEENNKNLNDAYREIAKLTHDFKNHMCAMTLLAQNEKYPDLADYLRQVSADVDNVQILSYSGIESIDAVINNKRVVAENNGIEFEFNVTPLYNLCVRSMDLCAVIVNLLDNAIEACMRLTDSSKRKVYFSVSMIHSMIVVKTENFYDQSLVSYLSEGEIETTKKNRKLHGYGLQIVKTLAEKYNGSFETMCANEQFVAVAMLANDN